MSQSVEDNERDLRAYIIGLTWPESACRPEMLQALSELTAKAKIGEAELSEAKREVLEEISTVLLKELSSHHPSREVNLREGLRIAVSMVDKKRSGYKMGTGKKVEALKCKMRS